MIRHSEEVLRVTAVRTVAREDGTAGFEVDVTTAGAVHKTWALSYLDARFLVAELNDLTDQLREAAR